MRMVRPAHPGQFIRMEVIEPLDLSVTQAAKALGVTRAALSALLNGRAALSPEMALRIEKAFGPRMDTLLRMQTAYEIEKGGIPVAAILDIDEFEDWVEMKDSKIKEQTRRGYKDYKKGKTIPLDKVLSKIQSKGK